MDLQYFPEDASVVARFDAHESDEASIVMALVADEEKRNRIRIPEISNERLNEMAGSREGAQVTFPYEFQEFALAFLERISERWYELEWDYVSIDYFLFRMRGEFSPVGKKLQ